MLEAGMSEEKESVLKIDDTTPNTLRQLLQYIYSGKLELEDFKDLKELLKLGHKYQLVELVDHYSKELLMKGLTEENALELGILGDMLNSSILTEASAKYIKENLDEETLPEGWEQQIEGHQQLMIAVIGAMRKKIHRDVEFSRLQTVEDEWKVGPDFTDTLGFRVFSQAKLVGVGAYCTEGENNVTIRVFRDNKMIFEEEKRLEFDGEKVSVRLGVESPVKLEKDRRYEVSLEWGEDGNTVCSGTGGRSKVKMGSVEVIFNRSGRSRNNTNVEKGQIPAIYLDYLDD